MEQETLVGFRQLYPRIAAGRNERALRVWLWRNIRAGLFPAPLVLSPNSRAWRESDIAAWEAKLKRASYAPEA